jgi:chromate transporter
MRTMRILATADHFPSPPLVFASSAGYNVTVVMLKTTTSYDTCACPWIGTQKKEYMHGGVVKGHHWLTDHQFVDAVAVAMITPGPVVITVGFIGYLVAGPLGACVAALATFLPCYTFVVIAAPAFRKYGRRPAISAFVTGVTAGAVGAITGAVVVLGRRTITDVPTALLALVTVLVLWKWKKLPEPLVVLSAAIIGFVMYTLIHR